MIFLWRICVCTISILLLATSALAAECIEECTEPSFLVDPPATTEWEAEMEAKCFTACVDLVSACYWGVASSHWKHPQPT